jgi:hypothetical protein
VRDGIMSVDTGGRLADDGDNDSRTLLLRMLWKVHIGTSLPPAWERKERQWRPQDWQREPMTRSISSLTS